MGELDAGSLRENLWKEKWRSEEGEMEKGTGVKRTRCWAGYHCGQLRISPTGDPLRNHVKHTSKLSFQGRGRWCIYLLKSGASGWRLFPWVLTSLYVWATKAEQPTMTSEKVPRQKSRQVQLTCWRWKGSRSVQHSRWHQFGWRVAA